MLTPHAWIIRILLGGLLGMLGQGLRTVSGLKKMYDAASQQGSSFKAEFETSRLMVSLFIGFIAGSLAVLAMDTGTADWTPGRQELLTLIGAGYAGADFVEGFVARYIPTTGSSTKAAGGGTLDAEKNQVNTTAPIDDHDVPAVG